MAIYFRDNLDLNYRTDDGYDKIYKVDTTQADKLSSKELLKAMLPSWYNQALCVLLKSI